MRKIDCLFVVCVALVLVVLPLLGACGEKEVVKEVVKEVPVEKEVVKEVVKEVPVEKEVVKEVPVEKPIIKVGGSFDITGPVGVTGSSCWKGYMDAVGFWNDRYDGVEGMKVEALWYDDQHEAAGAIKAYEAFKAQGMKAYYSMNVGSSIALKERGGKDKIPVQALGAHVSLIKPPGWAFAMLPEYGTLYTIVWRWMEEDWDMEEMGRPARVAAIVIDWPSGHAFVDPTLELYCEQSPELELVGTMFHPPTAIEFSSELRWADDLEPDYIFFGSADHQEVALVRQAKELGLLQNAKLGLAQMAMYFDYLTENLEPELLEGVVGLTEGTLPFEEDEYPIWKEIKEWQMETKGTSEIKGLYYVGFSATNILLEVMSRAVKKVGYENLNGDAIYDAYEKLKDFDNSGLTAPVSYDETRREGIEKARLMTFKDGQPTIVTDFLPITRLQ